MPPCREIAFKLDGLIGGSYGANNIYYLSYKQATPLESGVLEYIVPEERPVYSDISWCFNGSIGASCFKSDFPVPPWGDYECSKDLRSSGLRYYFHGEGANVIKLRGVFKFNAL